MGKTTYLYTKIYSQSYMLTSHKVVCEVQFNPDKCNKNKRNKLGVQMVPQISALPGRPEDLSSGEGECPLKHIDL